MHNVNSQHRVPHILHGQFAWATALFLLSLGLYLYGIDSKSLWLDEALTLNATATWGDLWTRVVEMNGGSWIYYVLVMPWRSVVDSEMGLRALSAVFASGAAVTMFFLASKLGGRLAGVAAAVALAMHPLLLQHAQEVRVYSLLVFLVTMNGLVLLHAVERGTWFAWLGCGTVGLVCISAHFFALFAVAAQMGGAFVLWRKQINWPAAATASLGIALGLVGQILLFDAMSAGTRLSYLPAPGLWQIPGMVAAFSGGGRDHQVWFYLLVGTGALLSLASLVPGWRSSLPKFSQLTWSACWLFGPLAGVFLYSYLFAPAFLPRYVISALPGACLLLGLLLGAARPRWLVIALCIGIGAVQVSGMRAWYSRPPAEDWRSAADYYLKSGANAPVLLFRYYVDAPFRYYVESKGSRYSGGTPWGLPGDDWVYWLGAGKHSPITFSELPATLQEIDDFWIVLSHVDDSPEGTGAKSLLLGSLSDFRISESKEFQSVTLLHLRRSPK